MTTPSNSDGVATAPPIGTSNTTSPPLSTPLDIRRVGRVLMLTMNDPSSRNALNQALYTDGTKALHNISDDIGAVILCGANGTFCSGGDLRELKNFGLRSREEQSATMDAFHGFIQALRDVPVPVIAAVEGSAAGAGFSMAMACDLIVAAETALFAMAYVKVGLNPDGGASAFLSRGLPHQIVAELLYTGDPISPARLHILGCINRLTNEGQALDEAMKLAIRLAQGPRAALSRAKRLIEAARRQPLDIQLDLEAYLFMEATHHREAEEGISAFFEKRIPDFTAL